MPRPDISQFAKQGAQASARSRKKLTMEMVEEAFGQLVTLEDAMRRLDKLGVWTAAGLMAGSVAGASVRSVEVWIKAHESTLTRKIVDELRADLDRVKAEMKQRQPLRAVQ